MPDLFDYVCGSEDRYHYNYDNDYLYYAYIEGGYCPLPHTSIKKPSANSSVANHSPYLNEKTNTWWEYDDSIERYVDSGVKASVTVQEVLDQYEDDDIPLTLDEVKEILV